MKKFRVFLGIILLTLAFVGFDGSNTMAAGFRAQIDIVNSAAPELEPEGEYTGAIEWVTESQYDYKSGDECVLEIDYDIRLFSAVKVNGGEIRLGVDYSLEEGSTVVAFETAYMDSLEPGKYAVDVVYTNGRVFSTEFAVVTDGETDSGDDFATPNTGGSYVDDAEGGGIQMSTTVLGAFLAVGGVMFVCGMFRRKRFGKQSDGWIAKMQSWLLAVREALMRLGGRLISLFRARGEKNRIQFSLRGTRKTTMVISVVVFAIVACVCFGVLRKLSDGDDVQATLYEVPDSLSITVTNGDFTAEADLSNGSQFIHTSQDVSVDLPTRNGYQLFVSTNSDTYNDLSINGSKLGEERITASEGTEAEPVALEADEWGYAVADGAFGENYTPSIESLWAGVPVYGSQALLKTVYGATSENDTTRVYYGFNVTDNLPDGSYWGTENSTVVYIAVANEVPDYTIQYDCNGGNGEIASQSGMLGDVVQLSNGAECVKDEYHALGWSTDRAGVEVEHTMGENYSLTDDLYLYVVWEADPQPEPVSHVYTLRYDANGGSGAPVEQQRVSTDAQVDFSVNLAIPVLENHTFLGWSSEQTAASATYHRGDVFKTGELDNVLYAVWHENEQGAEPSPGDTDENVEYTYVLQYELGEIASATIEPTVIKSKLEVVTAEVTTFEPQLILEDQVFEGWSSSEKAATVDYKLGDSIELDVPVKKVYPVTKKKHTYNLNYNANGGEGAPGKQSVKTTANSASFTVSNVAPTRSGYTFRGWATNKTASSAKYSGGDSITIKANTTLYAVWKKNAPVKVSGITISGSKNIDYNGANKIQLGVTVTPSNAANRSVTWSSANNKVAKVDSNGMVKGVNAGTATIVAKANDGSGVKATHQVVVKKKIIIVVGASQVSQWAAKTNANVQSWVSSASGDKYVRDNTLFFFNLGGSGIPYQYNKETYSKNGQKLPSGWKKANDQIVKYENKKDYVSFYVYFPIPGNTTRNYTCDGKTSTASMYQGQISSKNSNIITHVKGLNDRITEMKRAGYGIKGYVISNHPIQARANSVLVSSNDKKRCDWKYRSNYKYYKFNKAIKAIIDTDEGRKYSNLEYVPLFSSIVNAGEIEKGKDVFRMDDYQTKDGLHWDKSTAVKYLNLMLKRNSAL